MTNLDNFLSLPIITQRNRRGTGLDSQGIVILCHLSQISLLFGYFILKRMQKGPQCQELPDLKQVCGRAGRVNVVIPCWALMCAIRMGKMQEDEGKRVLVWLWCALCHPCLLSKPKILHSHPQQPCPACQQLSRFSLSQTHTRVRKQGSGVPLSRGIEELQASFPLFLYRVLQLVERGRREAVPLNFPWHFNQAWILKIKKLFAKISVI